MSNESDIPVPGDLPQEQMDQADDTEQNESDKSLLQESLKLLESQSPLPREFQELKPQARLIGLGLAQSQEIKDIAKTLRCSYETVRRWSRRPVVKAYVSYLLDTIENKVMNVFETQAVSAARTVAELNRMADKDSVRLAAANTILDRVLGRAMEKHEHRIVTFGDLLDELRKPLPSNIIDAKEDTKETPIN